MTIAARVAKLYTELDRFKFDARSIEIINETQGVLVQMAKGLERLGIEDFDEVETLATDPKKLEKTE